MPTYLSRIRRAAAQTVHNAVRRTGREIVPIAPPEPELPADMSPDFAGLYEACHRHSMTSPERLYAVYEATRYVVKNDIAGDFVECGVWRGGSSMLAALALQEMGELRTMWLYDTFEGMSAPTERDIQHDGQPPGEFGEGALAAPIEQVRANMATTGIDDARLVQGKVEATIPGAAPDQIAFLRLDTDWYESTRHELEHLYPRLAPGGILIIDDYGHWAGARSAVDEYFASRARPPLLNRIDYTARMAIKPQFK